MKTDKIISLVNDLVEIADVDSNPNAVQDLIKELATLIGSKKFKTGSVNIALDTIFYSDDLEEDDEFKCDVILTNLRTGEVIKNDDIYTNRTDVDMDYK